MREYCLQARAKVNLTVDVLRRRADGYHEVDLLMQSVSLCDTLRLREAEDLELTIEVLVVRSSAEVVVFQSVHFPMDESSNRQGS